MYSKTNVQLNAWCRMQIIRTVDVGSGVV